MRVQLRAFFKYDSGRQLLPLPPNGYIHSLVNSVFLLKYASTDRNQDFLGAALSDGGCHGGGDFS